jgi:hypothetical protein
MGESQRITCVNEDISPPITPSPSRTGTAPPRRHGRHQLLGRLPGVGESALRTQTASNRGTALRHMTTKDFPDASWLSVGARSRSRSRGAPPFTRGDRAPGKPFETGVQTCQPIACIAFAGPATARTIPPAQPGHSDGRQTSREGLPGHRGRREHWSRNCTDFRARRCVSRWLRRRRRGCRKNSLACSGCGWLDGVVAAVLACRSDRVREAR